MTRASVLGAIACAIALSLGPGARAAEDEPPRAAAEETPGEEAEEWAGWLETLDESLQRIRVAQARIRELENAKGRGAHRQYPRGEAKATYLRELEQARKELAESLAQHPDLLEQARQAGVPAGVLADYEEVPADAGPPGGSESEDEDQDEDAGDEEIEDEVPAEDEY
jgi:hypothetical protein